MKNIKDGSLGNPAITALAAILFLSPSMFGFFGPNAATLSCLSGAIMVFLIAVSADFRTQGMRDWILSGIGLILAAAPWLLSFSGVRAAVWVHVVIGLGVVAVCSIDLTIRRRWFHHARD